MAKKPPKIPPNRIPVKAHSRGKKMPPPPSQPITPAPAPGEANDDYQSDMGDGGF